MKHKGNISEIQLIRNKEIVRTFIELKKTCTFSYYKDICKEIAGMKSEANLRLIVRLAIERPSDSFGISPDRIQHILWKAGMK